MHTHGCGDLAGRADAVRAVVAWDTFDTQARCARRAKEVELLAAVSCTRRAAPNAALGEQPKECGAGIGAGRDAVPRWYEPAPVDAVAGGAKPSTSLARAGRLATVGEVARPTGKPAARGHFKGNAIIRPV